MDRSVSVGIPNVRRRQSKSWRRYLLVPAAAAAVVLLLLFNNAMMVNQLEVYDEVELDEFQFLHSRRAATSRAKEVALQPTPPIWSAPSAPVMTTASACLGSHGIARKARRPNPVAAPAAIVAVGEIMRFTVLTDSVVRIEHRGGGKQPTPFDDRATFAIVNRHLPPPPFEATLGACELLRGRSERCLVIQTKRLRLEQAAPTDATRLERRSGTATGEGDGGEGDGGEGGQSGQGEGGEGGGVEGWIAPWAPPIPTSETLRVRVQMQQPGGSDEVVEWWPGKPNPRQLPGTVRTLDNTHGATELRCDALPEAMQTGMKDDAHCAMGLISRDGWALLDDTHAGRFNGAASRGGWDWAAPHDPGQVAADRAAVSADGDARCAGWARSGECIANEAFMRASCKAACEREAARKVEAAARAAGTAPGRVDWYLFGSGLDFKGALRDLAALSGEQPVPPRYAFGVWFSRWWPYADWESEALLREFDERGVPCDVLITDMDWHHTCYRRTYGSDAEKSMDASHNWPCWSGFSFDRKYFASPETFLGWCKARGVHNGFNLHFQSGLVKAEEDGAHWESFAAAMGLPRTAEFAAFDPLNETYSTHFHTHVLAPLERQGVDFWWLDWQQGEALFAGSDVPEANPTWWLNYIYGTQPDGRAADRALQAAPTQAAPTQAAPRYNIKRPRDMPLRRRLIMHRWGGLGNQRYPIGFSGDTASSWASLAFQPHFTSSAANVNFGYWSHDVGGFYEPCEPELYVRWIQFGALSPIFRSHGFRATNIEKRFWIFDDQYFVPMRAALRLRLELLPHLYTAARLAFDGGPSPIRPLYHEWPHLDAAFKYPNQYLFGEAMAVAPVTKRCDASAPLARGVRLWVPPGQWVLTHTGLAIDGTRPVEGAFALDEIPILVQSGAWIFGATPPEAEWDHCSDGTRGWLGRAQRTPRCPQASLWLPSLAHAGRSGGGAASAALHGSGELYEDDGWSNRYRHDDGATSRTTLSWRVDGASDTQASDLIRVELVVVVHAARGCLQNLKPGAMSEPGQPRSGGGGGGGSGRRSWRLLLHGVPPPVSASVRRTDAPGSTANTNGSNADGEGGGAEGGGEGGGGGGGERTLRFVDPPAAEMRRRSDERADHLWWIDPDRLCLAVWLFDLPSTESFELRLVLDGEATALAAKAVLPVLPSRSSGVLTAGSDQESRGMAGALGAMRRAQTAKNLLDGTYPETQPQDYDQTTWIAGLGSRLAARPANYSRELAAFPALVRAARAQLKAQAGRRVSSQINQERVRNATALADETGLW